MNPAIVTKTVRQTGERVRPSLTHYGPLAGAHAPGADRIRGPQSSRRTAAMPRAGECDIMRSSGAPALHADRTRYLDRVTIFGRRARALARRVRAVLFPWTRASEDETRARSSFVGRAADRVQSDPTRRAPRTRREERPFDDRLGPRPLGLRGCRTPARRERRPPHRSRGVAPSSKHTDAGLAGVDSVGPLGTSIPEQSWLRWWSVTGRNFGLMIQAMVPLSGSALASALAEETVNEARHLRLHRGHDE
jgi:hypothetical protein